MLDQMKRVLQNECGMHLVTRTFLSWVKKVSVRRAELLYTAYLKVPTKQMLNIAPAFCVFKINENVLKSCVKEPLTSIVH